MAANTAPIYTITPHIGWGTADGDGGSNGPIKTANTAMDGTGTTTTIFTAGTNGSYVKKLIARAEGTCIASVLRVFVNNGSASSSSVNNILIAELSLPATTASNNSALQDLELPLEFALPAGYKIIVAIGTSVSAGWAVSVQGGDY